MIISRCINVATNGIISLFLRLSGILLYECSTSLSVHLVMDKHCFQALVTANSAVMDIGMHVSFLIRIFSRYMPGVGLLDPMGAPFWFLEEPPFCSPSWLLQLTLPPTAWEGSFFSTLSPAFIICRLFNDGYSEQGEVIPFCTFDFHFLTNQRC